MSSRWRVTAGVMAMAVVALFAGGFLWIFGGSGSDLDITAGPGDAAEPSNPDGEAGGDFDGGSRVFSAATGAVMLLDDGMDGVLAVDLDRGVATRVSIWGSAGDQPFRLWLTGGALVAGWGQINVAELPRLEPRRLAAATIFVPAAEDGRVWLVDYPGGRIGQGTPTYELVTIEGEVLVSEEGLEPGSVWPAFGYAGGLVHETTEGILLWQPGDTEPTELSRSGPGFVSDTHADLVAWCVGPCLQLLVTDTQTMEEFLVTSPVGGVGFDARTARFSPDGRLLAAIVGGDVESPEALVVADAVTGEIVQQWPVDVAGPVEISWHPDGAEVYLTGYSWGADQTDIGRYSLDGSTEEATLPFGGITGGLVVEASSIDLSYVDALPQSDCPARSVSTSQPASGCSFVFSVESAAADLFAEHERWVATSLDGLPIVDGPRIESLEGAQIALPEREGLIGGCSFGAAFRGFRLIGDQLVVDDFPTIDLDCDANTDPGQAQAARDLILNGPAVRVARGELIVTDGDHTLTFDAIPTLDRIEAKGGTTGTEQVTLQFTADLPDLPVSFVDQVGDRRPGAVAYTTQDSADGWVSVCGSGHSFPDPGNRTVDVLLPSQWFMGGAARDDDRVHTQAGAQVAKIIECVPLDGVVQISIWGAATADPNKVTVSLGERSVTVDIGTPRNDQ